MFDIGWIEMAVIAVVVIIFIGPKELPGVLRTLGQWVSKARAMAREFQEGLEDMARETGIEEAKREIETATSDIGGQIEKSIDPEAELKGAFDPDYHPPGESEEKPGPPEAETGAAAEEPETEPAARTPAEGEEPEDKESRPEEHSVPAKSGG